MENTNIEKKTTTMDVVSNESSAVTTTTTTKNPNEVVETSSNRIVNCLNLFKSLDDAVAHAKLLREKRNGLLPDFEVEEK